MGTILSILAGLSKLIGLVGSAMGWAHDKSEQQQGEQLHELSDLKQAEAQDATAATIDNRDAGLSDSQLDDKLRG
jgi:hypothetical protein